MMGKRRMVIGGYDTAADGLWTLAACKITKANQVQTIVEVPGRFAPIDLSTYLTDGQPYYGNAAIEATLESSEGDRAARQARIDSMVRTLDGRKLEIVPPDAIGDYLVGRVQVTKHYNDPAHCAVQVSAVCEPWLYAADETAINLTATADERAYTLTIQGGKPVVPTVTVTGEIVLEYGDNTWALSTGAYNLPGLYLTPGEHQLLYSGDGSADLIYREAVLAV